MENDLISRAALMEALANINSTDYGSMSDYRAHMAVGSALRDVESIVDGFPTIEAEPKWISVKERLPDNDRMVIGYTPCDGYMFVGYYVEDRNWKQWYIVTAMRSTKYMTKRVTHWMPLPEPPKEEE